MSEAEPIETAEAQAGTVLDNVVDLRKSTAAQRRESAIAFVKEHSGLAIAGSIAVGMLVALLLPRRRKSGRRSAALAEAVGAGAATLGRRALARAETASSELRREGGRAARHSEELGEAVAKHLGSFIHSMLERAEDLGETAAETAGKVTKLAAEHLGKAGEVAEDAALQAGHRIGKTVSEARSRIIG